MGYSELIKDFKRIRAYLRDFYIYGFKSRSDFSGKSPRSYDNERRRVESWMGDYVVKCNMVHSSVRTWSTTYSLAMDL